MMWNGIHLLISPAASHSGYEDHFQSDQFHYLHHAKFECNYGTSGPPMDKLFGTFREKIGRSLQFKGVSEEIKDIVAKPNEYLSGSLTISGAMPNQLDTLVYNCLVYSGLALFCLKATGNALVDAWLPMHVAWVLAYGPIVTGFLILIVFGDKKSYLWPFQKEKIIGSIGVHWFFAALMVVYPVHAFAQTVLADKGEAPYHFLFPSTDPVAAALNASVHAEL